MLISAVRYALGRRSYIIGCTCEFICRNKKRLSRECINIIIRDIKKELEIRHKSGKACGMDWDEREWIGLLNILNQEVRIND